jgi:HPt (histidine-containing phosphotransfer) domain-containing protein
MAGPTAHFNQEAFAAMVGDDPQLLQEIASLFIALQPARMEALGVAIAGREDAKVRSIAHALKGAFLSMSMVPLATTAASIERDADGRGDSSVNAAYAELELQFKQVMKELAALLQAEEQ